MIPISDIEDIKVNYYMSQLTFLHREVYNQITSLRPHKISDRLQVSNELIKLFLININLFKQKKILKKTNTSLTENLI